MALLFGSKKGSMGGGRSHWLSPEEASVIVSVIIAFLVLIAIFILFFNT